MAAIELDTVVVRGSGHVETRMGDQTVMMDISQGQYFALEASGQRIWELLEEPIRVRDVIDRLTAEYDVPRAECEAEVLAFLAKLARNGLLAERVA